MEVKEGYKRTELGVIPATWEVRRLSEVACLKSGEAITASSLDPSFAYPCFGGNGIRGHASRFTHDGSFALIGRQGALCGNVAGVSGRFFASEHAVVVTPRPGTSIEYLTYVLGRMRLNRLSEASAQPGLSVSKILQVSLAVPGTESEQKAIAEALSDVDDLIASLERLIAKKRDIKAATMGQLLTGRTRLPGFTGEWERKRLGELGAFLKGRGVKKDETRTGELPCVRYGELYTHHHDHIRSFNSWISRAVADAATRLRRGDLLFAGSGETKAEIGKCVAFLHDCEAYAGGDIVILRAIGVDSRFLGYKLNTPEIAAQKASYGQGDAVVHIGAGSLAAIGTLVPRLAEQTAIAAVLSDMDAETEALQARLAKTRMLKQGMMQELLTGRTRLV